MTVYAEQGRLPESVAQLYHQVVDVLCKLRSPSEGGDGPPAPGGPTPVPSPFPTWNSKKEALAVVFEAMQVRATAAGGKSRTALVVEDAAGALRRARPQDFPDLEAGKSGLDRLYDETGLLRFEEVPVEGVEGRPVKVVRPWHASFSDYLVAWQKGVRAESVIAGTDALLRGAGGLASYSPGKSGLAAGFPLSPRAAERRRVMAVASSSQEDALRVGALGVEPGEERAGEVRGGHDPRL